jgi:CelD/BcsL family acetyltransferase involved in cellulose biosynthesis
VTLHKWSVAPSEAGTLTVEVLTDMEALTGLGPEWDALLYQQPLPSPTMAADWVTSLPAAHEGGELIVLVRRGGALVGAGAFRTRRIGPLRVATWLGGARLPEILVAPGVDVAAERVLQAAFERAHVLWLPRMPVGGVAWRAFRAVAPWRTAVPVIPGGWVVELPPPRLEYARRKAEYARRRAVRRGAKIAVTVMRHPDDVCAGFERLVHLYRHQWRDRAAEGDRYSDVVVRADGYRELLPALAAAGRVRIVEVFDDGELAASKLGLLAGRGALFHTTATAPRANLRGPGHIAMLTWVEEAIAANAQVMYLGRGAGDPEGPKARLGPTEVPLADVLAARSVGSQRVLEASRRLVGRLRRIR